jgi:hypothetical protein
MLCLEQSRQTDMIADGFAREDRRKQDPVAAYPVSAAPQRDSRLNLTGQPYPFDLNGFILRDASLRDAPQDEGLMRDSCQTLMVRSRALRGVSELMASSFETHRVAMLLRMRTQTLMVRSRALRGVSNHEASGEATMFQVSALIPGSDLIRTGQALVP